MKVSHEALIRNSKEWAMWPYLPIVRRPVHGGEPELGVIVESGGKVLTTVFLCNLFVLPSKNRLCDGPKIEYESVAELLQDGWEVD